MNIAQITSAAGRGGSQPTEFFYKRQKNLWHQTPSIGFK
jgi:hypothetical protein